MEGDEKDPKTKLSRANSREIGIILDEPKNWKKLNSALQAINIILCSNRAQLVDDVMTLSSLLSDELKQMCEG